MAENAHGRKRTSGARSLRYPGRRRRKGAPENPGSRHAADYAAACLIALGSTWEWFAST